MARIITINGDDFGWNKSCTEAILRAFDLNLVQTSTIICTGAYFDDAVALLDQTELRNRVGIHFALTEGTPLTQSIRSEPFFCDQEGIFHMHVNRYSPLTYNQKKCAYEELTAQAKRFQQSGLSFHHADSHHHIHTAPNLFPIVLQVIRDFGIEKVRISRNLGMIPRWKRLLKYGFNQRIRLLHLDYSDYFGSISEYSAASCVQEKATVELMCHPDTDSESRLIDRSDEAPYDSPFGTELLELQQRAGIL